MNPHVWPYVKVHRARWSRKCARGRGFVETGIDGHETGPEAENGGEEKDSPAVWEVEVKFCVCSSAVWVEEEPAGRYEVDGSMAVGWVRGAVTGD